MTYAIGNKKKKIKTGPVPDSYIKPIRGEPMGMDIALPTATEIMTWANMPALSHAPQPKNAVKKVDA